jgi:hypothetical protein
MSTPKDNPWLTAPGHTTTDTSAPIDLSPAAILNRDAEIAAGIRQGKVKLSFSQLCRAAVARGVATGLVKYQEPRGDGVESL